MGWFKNRIWDQKENGILLFVYRIGMYSVTIESIVGDKILIEWAKTL